MSLDWTMIGAIATVGTLIVGVMVLVSDKSFRYQLLSLIQNSPDKDQAKELQSERYHSAEKNVYGLAFRNQYLAKRTDYLLGLIQSVNRTDVPKIKEIITPNYVLTDDVQEMLQINRRLSSNVNYLENYIIAYFPGMNLKRHIPNP